MLRPADTQLEAIISSTHRVLRVGQVCFVPWVILDHVTPRHGVLAAIELGQVKVQGWVKSSSSSSSSSTAASRSITLAACGRQATSAVSAPMPWHAQQIYCKVSLYKRLIGCLVLDQPGSRVCDLRVISWLKQSHSLVWS